ncbi:MAG: phosphoglucosamine mutase [Candidatus Eisenbacteria bacterium]|nr:phosphoglucosamine mutase [Candidatus Eisenbacteria bacterium]
MLKLKLGISGARGVIGETLTPEVVVRLAATYAAERAGRPVLVGGDTRPTGPMVRNALFAGLTAAGCPVLDCGVCPTPSILLAVARRPEAGGGILVTASHNPIEWNALKFVNERGFFLGPEEGEGMIRLFREGVSPWVPWDRVGRIEPGPDVEAEHLEKILKLPWIDAESIRASTHRVVLDGAGGSGSRLARMLLEKLGCVVTAIHCGMEGGFPRPPEPRPENLGALCRVVREEGAAVGFALDPDGDRLALVSDEGEPLGEESTVAIAVDYILERERGPVVLNLSTSRMAEELAERHGVPCLRTPVGEAHVAAEMIASGAVVGGEGNGGVMLPALHPMRDAAVGIALTLQAMTARGEGSAGLARRLPRYAIVKGVIVADRLNVERLLGDLRSRFGPGREDLRDGVHVAWPDRWVHVRASNTEPVVRVMAEAPDRADALRLQKAAAASLGDGLSD